MAVIIASVVAIHTGSVTSAASRKRPATAPGLLSPHPAVGVGGEHGLVPLVLGPIEVALDRLGLDLDRRFPFIDRRLAKHLDGDERRDHQAEAQNEPLPLQYDEQVIANLARLAGCWAIGPELSEITEWSIEGTLDGGHRH